MKYFVWVLATLLLVSCSKKQHSYSEEKVEKFKKDFLTYLNENNEYYKTDKNSPLLEKDKPGFAKLEYYDYNPDFRFEGPIHNYESPDTIIIFGSKNDERPSLKYGYFEFVFNEKHISYNYTK